MQKTLRNGIGMDLILIPAGKFTMGGDPISEQADENETPKHTVVFEKPFYLGKFQVTQSQWTRVMGTDPSEFKAPDRPVETVSHGDAMEFIKKMNEMEGVELYRLPTEAQWEYASRAGSESSYCFGPAIGKLGEYAWYKGNSDGKTHPVGLLSPNEWGLHDMHGNVHEWCSDWFDRNYYANRAMKDPQGPEKGIARVLRGGDWGSEEWYCRCAIRSLSSPDRRSPRVGFRVARLIE